MRLLWHHLRELALLTALGAAAVFARLGTGWPEELDITHYLDAGLTAWFVLIGVSSSFGARERADGLLRATPTSAAKLLLARLGAALLSVVAVGAVGAAASWSSEPGQATFDFPKWVLRGSALATVGGVAGLMSPTPLAGALVGGLLAGLSFAGFHMHSLLLPHAEVAFGAMPMLVWLALGYSLILWRGLVRGEPGRSQVPWVARATLLLLLTTPLVSLGLSRAAVRFGPLSGEAAVLVDGAGPRDDVFLVTYGSDDLAVLDASTLERRLWIPGPVRAYAWDASGSLAVATASDSFGSIFGRERVVVYDAKTFERVSSHDVGARRVHDLAWSYGVPVALVGLSADAGRGSAAPARFELFAGSRAIPLPGGSRPGPRLDRGSWKVAGCVLRSADDARTGFVTIDPALHNTIGKDYIAVRAPALPKGLGSTRGRYPFVLDGARSPSEYAVATDGGELVVRTGPRNDRVTPFWLSGHRLAWVTRAARPSDDPDAWPAAIPSGRRAQPLLVAAHPKTPTQIEVLADLGRGVVFAWPSPDGERVLLRRGERFSVLRPGEVEETEVTSTSVWTGPRTLVDRTDGLRVIRVP